MGDSFSDAELESVRANTTNVDFIECDACATTAEYDPVCGSDNKTYENESHLDCGLKCRGAEDDDSSDPSVLSIVHRGECESEDDSSSMKVDVIDGVADDSQVADATVTIAAADDSSSSSSASGFVVSRAMSAT